MWSRCEPRAPARACSAREWRRLSRLRDLNVAGRGGRCQSPIGGDESTRARRRARRTGRPARGCARKVRRRAAGEQRWEGRVVAAARSPRRASRGRCAGLDLARADEPGQYGEHLRRLVRRGADVLAGDLIENPLRSRLVEHRVNERGGVQHDHPPNSSRTEDRSKAVSVTPRAGPDPHYPFLPVRVPQCAFDGFLNERGQRQLPHPGFPVQLIREVDAHLGHTPTVPPCRFMLRCYRGADGAGLLQHLPGGQQGQGRRLPAAVE